MSQTLNGIRILCIDDHADTLEVLQYMLEIHGAEVRGAATAAEALQVLMEFSPRVMIADVCLPDEDGLALLRRIRHSHRRQAQQVRTIALSAHCSDRDRQLALAAGYERFVEKPFDEAQLLCAIQQVMYKDESAAA
jgi:CheY-like chemotaxis protein